MTDPDIGFDDIFKEICPNEFNEFGLKREMRFISERIIVEYDPTDHLSVREIMHPMDAFRSSEPYFKHKLTDKSKQEFVTAIDFHEHITYFPYSKNTGDICLARYISNFNDINFTKISGQNLCSLPGETIYGLRVGRLDKGMLAVNHRTDSSVNSTVTVIDLVKPARNIAHYDSYSPVNTIDWIWHGPFLLAVGDDESLRVMDVRCPKAFNAVFFDGGVQKTALCSTRPLEIACWNGSNVLLYDVRRPEVPCAIYDIGLEKNESILDMKFNPYITNELFVHTNSHRVFAMNMNPTHLIGGRPISEKPYRKWQVITFKHIDRGCTATRHTMLRREKMPYEDAEVPLLGYYGQYEAAKNDPQVPIPTLWTYPAEVDMKFLAKIQDVPEIDYESYLYKAVERVSAERDFKIHKPKILYQAKGVESFDFVFPGVNGIMCFDRNTFTYKIVRSPKHYEGSVNPYAGSDSVFFYRGLQIQEMIPAQTLTMMCNRLEAGWNAYQVSERSLKELAFKITEESRSVWAKWLHNSVIIQYGGKEFGNIGVNDLEWEDLVPLPDGRLPEVEIPPYEYMKDNVATEEITQMVAPFFRLFLPDPRPDLLSDSESETEDHNAPPGNPCEDDSDEPESGLPSELSFNMRTLCKCHAKIRYYNKKQSDRKYMYASMGNSFAIGSSKRIRDKFFKLGWKSITKPQILGHRLKIDTAFKKKSILDDLPKFQRFKPREFQKRVLPPKLITDSTSVFMKPEYIKEREAKEKEMREKAAQPIQAPIGLSMPKSSRKEPKQTPVTSDGNGEEDPEHARFMIRAAIQLADNNSSDDEIVSPPQATPTPPPAPTPTPHVPQALSVRNEKDDFEYETPEDAYFGIKKKRMYVVYQPATQPLGLRRYKPDRLRESTFIRRLEHLMYWGRRRHERDILYGRFEENDKRQSSVKERCTLDLKFSLNNHMKVGWQTFYDKNFFFSNKCSYNQILRKAIQMYNRLCGFDSHETTFKSVRHERMLCGVNPRNVMDKEAIEEARYLRKDISIIENSTIKLYNHFMTFVQAQLPYKLDHTIFMENFEGDTPFSQRAECPIEEKKQTAKYDENDKFMFPLGRLRFCEFDIPPNFMHEIENRRVPKPPKKNPGLYLEDFEHLSAQPSKPVLRRSNSCPDLGLAIESTENSRVCNEFFHEIYRRIIAYRDMCHQREHGNVVPHYGSEYLEPLLTAGVLQQFNTHSVNGDYKVDDILTNFTKFLEWDSPMISDTDRETGRKFMRRVVPFKEPQPPRQLEGIDPLFDYITIEVMRAAAKNLHVSYIFNDPILRTWPGLQILDEGRDGMFTLCPKFPRVPAEQLSEIDIFKSPLCLPTKAVEFYSDFFTEVLLIGRDSKKNRIRPPVYNEHNINVPEGLIEILKPAFYGFFKYDRESRYNEEQSLEMKNRRELQRAIFEKRIITFRQPVIEETEQELAIEENLNVEEDDLRTTSEESEGEDEVKNDSDPNDISDFWKIFKVTEDEAGVNGDRDSDEDLVQRKIGIFHAGDDDSYNCFNPHTRENIRKISVEEEEVEDEPKKLGSVLTNLFEQDLVKQKRLGDCPIGSPRKSSIKIDYNRGMVVPLTELTKQTKTVTWGEVTEHSVPPRPIRHRNRHRVEVDAKFYRDLYSVQLTRRVKSNDNFQKTKPARKNSDPTAVHHIGIPRRASLDQFYRKDLPATCSACIKEPWPTKEICIVCHPDTTIFRCTNIVNLHEPCLICGNNIYKFSCSNYEHHNQYVTPIISIFDQPKLKPVDEEFKKKLAVKNETVIYENTPAVWNVKAYRAGESAVNTFFAETDDRGFKTLQGDQLAGFFHREFNWVTWRMDEDKSERVFVSEEFDVAFDRDADIDMMRDTMNTISQDGEMDMMTTYDQRTGMRIRRWISYAALATRVQKQNEKVHYRKKAAEREARILSGEISVKPSLLNELKKKAKDKEVAATIATENDDAKKEEERRKAYKLWKKLPIPEFIEDPKKKMPNFAPPKSEDWLESSGSEDELPPIKSRILSKEMKEFIDTIRVHMEQKPKSFEGIAVTYGKLFEKRPILKNDIVLVTRKKNVRRKPPPFRIQRIPLDESWLNTAFTVSFLPVPVQVRNPRDPMKWTVPFYNSQRLALTAQETKERALRPPTPPPTLKKLYTTMKDVEKAFYHRKRVKSQITLKKAKTARQLRFHKKLYGHSKEPSHPTKAWTHVHRQIGLKKSKVQPRKLKEAHYLPGLAKQKNKYIFTYFPNPKLEKVKLSQRKPSRISSASDSEYCPIVKFPKVQKRVVELKEDHPTNNSELGIIERKKKELKREDPPAVLMSSTRSTLKRPETGSFVKREISVGKPALPKADVQKTLETVSLKRIDSQTEPKTESIKQRRHPIFEHLEDKSINNFSQGIPAISVVEPSSCQLPRKSRQKEHKITTNSNSSNSIDSDGMKMDRSSSKQPSVAVRSKSTMIPHSRKLRKQMPACRSFSVDKGSSYRKALKKIARKCRSIQKEKSKKVTKPDDSKPEVIPSDQKPKSQLETSVALPSKSAKVSTKKSEKDLSPLKSTELQLERKFLKNKVHNRRSSRAPGIHHQRPLHPRWLPTDHETDRKDSRAASQFRFQHMRSKRFTRQRKVLHKEPRRSRVLNTIRKNDSLKGKNHRMKYEQPIDAKISDMFLKPWKPLRRSKKGIRSRKKYKKNVKAKNTTKLQPMPWKQMLRKLADYNVNIKRVRLSDFKKIRPKQQEDMETKEKSIEIVVKPSNNLKSCLKRGQGHRSMKFNSQSPDGKTSSAGSNKTLKLVKTSAHSLAGTSPPKTSFTVPSLLELDDSSPLKNTWLTNTRKNSKGEKKVKENTAPVQQAPVPVSPPREETPEPTPSPPVRLLRPLSAESEEKVPVEKVDTPSPLTPPAASVPAPPPKMPADQQWRAAMMARRYMGASKPVFVKPPSALSKTESLKEASNIQESASTTRVQPALVVSHSTPEPVQLTRMAAAKKSEQKEYKTPVAKPKATAPPPITPKAASIRPATQKLHESELTKSEASRNVSSSSGKSQKQADVQSRPKLQSVQEKRSVPKVVKPLDPKGPQKEQESKKNEKVVPSTNVTLDDQASSSSNQQGPGSAKKPSASIFTALFGRKKEKKMTSSTAESSSIPIPSPENQEATSETNRSSPILPRIKKPETGQLIKRSPTSDVPKPCVVSGAIVKFVDGKPISNSPSYGKPMARRRPKKADSAADSGDLGSDEGSTSHEGCLKDEENSQKKPAGKTVRFGPISYEPPEPAPPQPVEIPKVEPTPEISFESLAQQMAQKTLRKEEASKILEHYPVTEQTSPSTAEPVSPTKSGSKLSFFGLSPFGKVTPKKNTAQTQSLTVLESTSSPELLTPSNPETSNTASTSSSKQPKSLSEEKITATQMIQTRGRPIRKLSHRRQLKIGDPSPLQLSGDSSLPRPAQPSPEKPPQLEVPQGVQTYNPPSQRKYYTRLGREWKPPPKAKTPLSIRVPQSGVSTSTPAIDLSAKEVLLAPIEKTKKMRKRKPKPMETTLVLDGTEHFKKLTAENLQLLSRQFKSKRKNKKKRTKTWSVIGCDENDDSTKCMQHNKLLEEFRDLKKSLITRQLDEKMITARAVFNPRFTDSSSTKHELLRNKPKFETTRKKLKRLANNRQQKIRMSGIHSQPKRDVAISAIRQVQKVRFFQSTGKKMMNPIISGFKPKSILKPPKPPATWLFRIDSEGNKLYMKKLGPSDWQKKNDEKCNPMSAMDPRKKKSNSYLKRWAKMMAKVGKKNMTKLFETNQLTRRLGAPKKDSHPKDVLVDPPKADAPPPSRSLSWTTVSSNASLNSLLDALNTVGSDEPSTSSGIVTDIAPPIVKEQFRKAKESRPTQQTVSKKYPTVYLGMTVARSPSSSTSLVNLDEREAVSSLAQDGSEIVEYVGQEEPVVETTKRRFDPFVRPISALFKAFTSSSPEVGLEADSRSRPTERTLRGLFRRSSPTMPEFSTRHVSSSPTRRRANRGPVTSVSQGSSAEDILALMQAQPDALENMEEQVVSKFPPIQLQAPVLNGKSMWRPKLKLKNSLYTQFKELKEESKKRKLVEYLDQNYKNNKSYSTLQTLITFNLDQYMRTNLYPRPKLNTDLLGKYDPNSLRVSSSSRSGLQRSTRLIVKKIRRCQEQLEKWKRLIATSTNQQLTNGELVKRAKASMKQASNRKAKKVLVLYKFKRTCFKYRVQVTITKSARKILADQNQKKQLIMHEEKKRTPTILTIGDEDDENEIVDLLSGNEDSANCQNLADYDGDNDDDAIDTELDWVANTSQVVIRKNQRRRLLRHYFNFAIRMARKVSRRSVGVQKPLVFYSFISQMRSRMRNFMRIRHNDQTRARQKNKLAVSNSTTTLKETRLRSSSKKQNRKSKSQRQIPICIRNSLKYGGTAEKKVIVEQSKFNFQKLNTKLQTFFECLDEYIDVGTPIKLVFSSKNTILPKKMFDVKTKLIDPVYYTSPSPCNTDSDFSDNTPDDYKSSDLKQFFLRESLESTYHVKGLPGLIYLARLVQERVADDVERNIPFRGPGMETCNLVVYMTPIRRLMLNSFGLRMPDRLDDVMLSKHQNEKFELWFDRLYRMLCYGRGDLCKYIIDKISLGQGPPNKKYEKMDITYQAHIIHKLYKKMMYIENGREAKLAVQEFMDIGLDIDHEPFSKQVKMGQYDRMLYGNPKPWNKDNWVEACDQFLNYSNTKEDVLVSCQASLLLMRMIFLGGYSQDVVDHLITMNLPMRDKLLFIINLTPPDNLVENIVKIFHTVRGLDRLPFVGLGYHADPLRVLFEEAVESGDPQLIAHIVRVGRCLDRRSREPMMTDCGSDHIQKRDFANIMTKVITNGNERRPYGAPTMDEMFPFRYVRNPDGSDVAETTEELANIMECEVTRYMAILELTKGAAVTKGDLDHNPKFNTYPHKFYFDVLCTGCKMNVSKGRNLGRLGRTLCVSTMPLIEQDKDKKRWPNAKTMSPRLTFENYIETLDPTENKMLMAKDIEEEKTDITVQVLPSRFGCFQCRFSLPRCCVCMCPYLNDHMDFALKDYNESFSQFSICNICNHGGHVNHIATWFETEKYCPVAGCDCRCQRSKQTKHLKARLRRHMLLSANMRAKSHLCNPECAIDADIDEGYLPDPDLALLDD